MDAPEAKSPNTGRVATIIISVVLAFCLLDAVHSVFSRRFVYLPIQAVFLLILIASYRLRPSHRANFALLLVGSIVALFAVEFALAILEPTMMARPAWKAGRTFDFRTREEVIRDLRRKGVDAFQRVAEGFPIAGPGMTLGGSISNATIVYCNETGQYSIFRSDEHGFNNPPGVWNAKPSQIVALGDSFTTGACVGPDEGFVSLIQKKYPATLNLGSGGNGPLVELAAMDEYAVALKPKIVLWCFFEGNDLDDLRHESAKPILMRYLQQDGFSQNLVGRQMEIDEAMKGPLEQAINGRRSVLLVPSIGLRFYGAISLRRFVSLHETHNLLAQVIHRKDKNAWKAEEAEMGLFRDVMAKAQKQISGWDGKLYFVYLPGTEILQNDPGRQTLRAEVLQTVKELGIPVIDVYPAFKERPDPLTLFSLPFPHYNQEGYRITAETILQALAANGGSQP